MTRFAGGSKKSRTFARKKVDENKAGWEGKRMKDKTKRKHAKNREKTAFSKITNNVLTVQDQTAEASRYCRGKRETV